MHARRFAKADDYIRRCEDIELSSVIFLPALAISAFASELYLKTLLFIETGNAPRGHNLKNLFRNLSSDTRRKIGVRWKAYLPRIEAQIRLMERQTNTTIPRDLDTMLGMGSRAFEELRYPGEHGSTAFFIADLPRLLDQTILEMRPDWRRVRFATPIQHEIIPK